MTERMTFYEAREKHRKRLEAAYKRLLAIASDQTVVNRDCDEFTEAAADLNAVFRDMIDLNKAEQSAIRKT